MRRVLSFLICFLYASSYALESVAAPAWKEEKGEHFIVFYMNESAKPKEVLRKAEFYYNRIADDLGYARHSNFWSWDKRVKIFIYADGASYRASTGQPDWSHGMASYYDKEIHSIEGTADFLDSVLPHEITHLIFRDFVGFKGEIPLWLDEGVAQWEEDQKRAEALAMMPQIVLGGYGMTVKRLMQTDIRGEKDPVRVAAFYTQAISLVDYLVRTHGTASFTVFCRELRDGKSLEEALRGAYPGTLSNLDDLETKWIKHVMQGVGTQTG